MSNLKYLKRRSFSVSSSIAPTLFFTLFLGPNFISPPTLEIISGASPSAPFSPQLLRHYFLCAGRLRRLSDSWPKLQILEEVTYIGTTFATFNRTNIQIRSLLYHTTVLEIVWPFEQ